MIAQTSLMAYYDVDLRSQRKTLCGQIYVYIRDNPGCTQPQIGEEFGLTPNRVSPRCNDLEKQGYIVKAGTLKEPLRKGRSCNTYKAVGQ